MLTLLSILLNISILSYLVAYFIIHPEKFEQWLSLIWKLVKNISSIFPKARDKIDKHYVASNIQDVVNAVCDRINKDSSNIFPHPLKIQWIKKEDKDTFIKNNTAIIRLKYCNEQAKNIVDALLLFLKTGFLPKAKQYLDEQLKKGCELKMASYILSSSDRKIEAFPYFIENEFNPLIESDKNFKRDIQLIQSIDSIGFLTRIFFTEIYHASLKLLGTLPNDEIREELRSFANFLHSISTKEHNIDVPLKFLGKRIKVAIILVARRMVLYSLGIKPYISRIEKCIKEGCDSIYIAAWGDEYIKEVIDIKNKLFYKNIVSVLRIHDYIMYIDKKGILIACQSNQSYITEKLKIENEVRDAVLEIIPEIREKKIEILSIAREKGIGMKIAVRSVLNLSDSTILEACLGSDDIRINELRKKFPDEFVCFVPWQNNIDKYIRFALSPLRQESISSIEIDEENQIIYVYLVSDSQLLKALGPKGYNVILASELIGRFIYLLSLSSNDSSSNDVDELIRSLRNNIPEILNDEIIIMKIARLKGIGSKVVVKWKKVLFESKKSASEICRGDENKNINKILSQINDRWIYFHDWFINPKDYIISCLYPLKRSSIKEISLTSDKKAIIHIDPDDIDINNVSEDKTSLTEKLTNYEIIIKSTKKGNTLSTNSDTRTLKN